MVHITAYGLWAHITLTTARWAYTKARWHGPKVICYHLVLVRFAAASLTSLALFKWAAALLLDKYTAAR